MTACVSQHIQNGKLQPSPDHRSNGVATNHTRWTLHSSESARPQQQHISNGNGYSHRCYDHGEGEQVVHHQTLQRSLLHKRSHSSGSTTSSDETRQHHRHAHPPHQELELRAQQPHDPVAGPKIELNSAASYARQSRTEATPTAPQTPVKAEENGSNGDAHGRETVQLTCLSTVKNDLHCFVLKVCICTVCCRVTQLDKCPLFRMAWRKGGATCPAASLGARARVCATGSAGPMAEVGCVCVYSITWAARLRIEFASLARACDCCDSEKMLCQRVSSIRQQR